jgi:hypothetical protein
MSRVFASIAVLTCCLAVPVAAQVRGGMGFGGGRPAGPVGVPAGHFAISFHARPSGDVGRRFTAAPFTGLPGYYADYLYENPGVQPPQVTVVQPAPTPAAQPKEDPKPPVPLMIERRGDRFVRYHGSERAAADDAHGTSQVQARSGASDSQPTAESNSPPQSADSQPPLPVLLLLRDGRREEATSYAIISGVLYKYADQWNGGSWAEKIQLSDLDISGTIRANRERGINFVLPAAPNQIIARP